MQFAHSPSKKMSRMQKCDRQSGDEIVPTVCEHSRAQAATKECKHAEERSINCQQEHGAYAFISVRGAEHQGGKHDASHSGAARPSSELTLQIAAKYQLFSDADQKAQKCPTRNFPGVGGCNCRDRTRCLLLRFVGREGLSGMRGRAQMFHRILDAQPDKGDCSEHHKRPNPECKRNDQVETDGAKVTRYGAEERTQRNLPEPQSKGNPTHH